MKTSPGAIRDALASDALPVMCVLVRFRVKRASLLIVWCVICGLSAEGVAGPPGVRSAAAPEARRAVRVLPVDAPDAGEHALLIDHRVDAYAVFQFIPSKDVRALQAKISGMKRVALVDMDAFLKAPYAYLRPLTKHPHYAGAPLPSVLVTSLCRDKVPMGLSFTGQLLVTATDYRLAELKYQELARDPAAFRVKHPTRVRKVNPPPAMVMVDARRDEATVYVGLSAEQAKGFSAHSAHPGVQLVSRAAFQADPLKYIPRRDQDTVQVDGAFARRVWHRVKYLRAGDSVATSWAGEFLYSSRDIAAARAAKAARDAKGAKGAKGAEKAHTARRAAPARR